LNTGEEFSRAVSFLSHKYIIIVLKLSNSAACLSATSVVGGITQSNRIGYVKAQKGSCMGGKMVVGKSADKYCKKRMRKTNQQRNFSLFHLI
jgi:hypothetical protein